MINNTSFTVHHIQSLALKREVRVDLYSPKQMVHANAVDLLIVNDGQDVLKMDLRRWLDKMGNEETPLWVMGVHAGAERKLEYGVTGKPDFMNRGSKADLYTFFLLQEMLPYLKKKMGGREVRNKYVAGFSLGGLMAFDLALEFPAEFNAAGVFSGSFWWRSIDLKDDYVEERDRIMHAKIRTKQNNLHQRFFLQTGAKDEKAERNKNGIIDSIDDTLDIIHELEKIGFQRERQITYVELPDGTHDVATWSSVMPAFLSWLYMK
jgi:enterochelin esterase-like enzyme